MLQNVERVYTYNTKQNVYLVWKKKLTQKRTYNTDNDDFSG